MLEQLGQELAGLGVADDGAHGHAHLDVVGRRAELAAVALLAVLGALAARVAVVDQGVDVRSATARRCPAAAVAAVRAAERDELLAPEAHAAVAAVAGGDVDGGFVDELHGGGW